MEKIFLSLAALLLTSGLALAQDAAKPRDVKQDNAKPLSSSKKAVTISGQVSVDGKTLVSAEDDIWPVSNPAALSGLEGQQVTVKCQVSPDKNSIHVFFVKTGQREVKYLAKNNDSAFRR
jgi:hypothetical protein